MVGKITNVPWGFRFLHHDCPYPYECTWAYIPVRHPAQLYEAICYFISFLILLFLYWKRDLWKKPGVIFGAFLIFIFGARILVEFFKENQSETDDAIALMTGFNTGQWLSVPLVLVGIYLIYKGLKKKGIA
jgi:prolipoprotein diacylglyceryltransferase